MSSILPLPQTFKLVTPEGYYTPEFKRYLDSLLQRTGGISGGTLTQLKISGGASVWDLNAAPIAVLVLTENISLGNPLLMVAGNLFPYRLTLVQDGTGGRTVSWGSAYKFPSGVPPTLSTGANATDELWFSCDGTNMKACVGVKDLR